MYELSATDDLVDQSESDFVVEGRRFRAAATGGCDDGDDSVGDVGDDGDENDENDDDDDDDAAAAAGVASNAGGGGGFSDGDDGGCDDGHFDGGDVVHRLQRPPAPAAAIARGRLQFGRHQRDDGQPVRPVVRTVAARLHLRLRDRPPLMIEFVCFLFFCDTVSFSSLTLPPKMALYDWLRGDQVFVNFGFA